MIKNTVSQLKCEDQVRIVGYTAKGDPVFRARLLAMGLTPGTVFKVSRIAPLGDPIEIIVRGYPLSLRKTEAGILKIELI